METLNPSPESGPDPDQFNPGQRKRDKREINSVIIVSSQTQLVEMAVTAPGPLVLVQGESVWVH